MLRSLFFFFSKNNSQISPLLAEFRFHLPSMHRVDMPVLVSINPIHINIVWAVGDVRVRHPPRGLTYGYSSIVLLPVRVFVLGKPPIGIFG